MVASFGHGTNHIEIGKNRSIFRPSPHTNVPQTSDLNCHKIPIIIQIVIKFMSCRFFVILNHPPKNEDPRTNISYSPHTKRPPIRRRLIVLKFGLDMFLRYINDLTKYGPDRPILDLVHIYIFYFFIHAGKNDVNHS